jgi:hypothetical protein
MDKEINNIKIGEFSVDLFINENGNLGIAVENKKNEDSSVDIFVTEDLEIVHG